jgi:5-methylcytosine-specific restriction protein A
MNLIRFAHRLSFTFGRFRIQGTGDMPSLDQQRAAELAKRWGLQVRHALYRKTGTWYHRLKRFPGALLDADGYVVFESEQAFLSCPQLQVKKQVGAPKGIKAIPGYVFMSVDDGQRDRMLVESVVRARASSARQGWRASVEHRKAVEAHAMALAVEHYSRAWREVVDVSASEPFDLLCRDGNRELRVEVKGTISLGRSILLSRNEVRHAQENPERVALFVVSEIAADASGRCRGGVIQVLEPWDIGRDELDPIAFECKLSERPNE